MRMKGTVKISTKIFLLFLLTFSSACSHSWNRSGDDSRRLSRLRTPPSSLQRVEIELSRDKLLAALRDRPSVTRIRAVEIFQGNPLGEDPIPNYRLFDITPGSVYEMMGLQNTDVVVGANDRILVSPNLFRQFVELLPQESHSELEIIRAGDPMLFEYKIVN